MSISIVIITGFYPLFSVIYNLVNMKHISYNQFKNIFGDWGATYWTKHNWLSNGLPDGVYNGITKVTITSVEYINSSKRGYISNVFPIAVANNVVWGYGFSNYEVTDANTSYTGTTRNMICVDLNGFVFVNLVGIPQTKAAYDAYLKKHPIILCYYNKNEWQGTRIDDVIYASVNGLYYANIGVNGKEVRDPKGNFENIESTTAQTMMVDPRDMIIMNGSTASNRMYAKDVSLIGGTSEQFKNKYLPMFIVYK